MARNTTLTEELAAKLEFYWQLAGDTLTDEQICWKLEISFGQLRGWLQRNIKPLRPDKSRGPAGLRDIRARAKVSTMTGYLVKLNTLADRAQAGGDFSTAANTWKWLLEKQFPLQYGSRAQVDDQQQGKTGVLEVPTVEPDKQKWSEQAQAQGQEQPAPPGPTP